MPSFDVVSELDKHEVTNAIDNAIKELERRYDLRGKGSFELKELTVNLTADADFQLEQMIEILKIIIECRTVVSGDICNLSYSNCLQPLFFLDLLYSIYEVLDYPLLLYIFLVIHF